MTLISIVVRTIDSVQTHAKLPFLYQFHVDERERENGSNVATTTIKRLSENTADSSVGYFKKLFLVFVLL